MSLREAFPKPRLSRSHYFLTLARGDDAHCIALRPWLLYATAAILPAVALVGVAASLYLVFRDDMLSALLRRQNEMQFAYEDRLAALRSQIDRVTSRQVLDQDSIEGKVHELLSRQAQLETRAALMSRFADKVAVNLDETASIPKMDPPRAAPDPRNRAGKPDAFNNALQAVTPSTAPGTAREPVAGALGFAPLPQRPTASPFPDIVPQPLKPRPEGADGRDTRASLMPADAVSTETLALQNPDLPIGSRIGTLTASLDKIEVAQLRGVSALASASKRKVAHIRSVLSDAGLSPDKLTPPLAGKQAGGVGGPFIPMKFDSTGSVFEREMARFQDELLSADRLTQLLPTMPLRKPLPGSPDVTSPFGTRVDPFNGRLSLHPGMDIRLETGALVRATGAGTVTSAGPAGGYGNMVEIDHGNGLVTRYGHLSAVLVSEGQTIEAGAILGKGGSTGRSTGPHLHYEVRINDEPVDPVRFLKAGARLSAETQSAGNTPVKLR